MNRKVLIVDDDAHIRLLLEQTLEDVEEEGVEVFFAENGEKALIGIDIHQPRLIFLDVMMPNVSGFDICRQVKQSASGPETYVVLLTAKGQEIDRQKGIEAGADQYMTKPFDPDKVLDLTRAVLELEQE